MFAVVARDDHVENFARLGVRRQPHRRELLGAGHVVRLREHAAACADLAIEMTPQRRFAVLAQQPRALLANGMRHLRHARGRRAEALGIGKHM